MDLNQLLHRHQLSLMRRDQAESPEERDAHSQFASDYATKIGLAREELGAPAKVRHVALAPDNRHPGPDTCVTARVALTSSSELPYEVTVFHDLEVGSRQSFRTMREAEIYMRRVMPTPAPISTLYDRKSGQV